MKHRLEVTLFSVVQFSVLRSRVKPQAFSLLSQAEPDLGIGSLDVERKRDNSFHALTTKKFNYVKRGASRCEDLHSQCG